jgi:hypothetical protein
VHDDEAFVFDDVQRNPSPFPIVHSFVGFGQNGVFEYLSGIKDVYAVFFHYLSALTRIPLKLHITFFKKDL